MFAALLTNSLQTNLTQTYICVTFWLRLIGVTLELRRDYIRVTLGLQRGYIGITFGLHLGYIRVTLGLHVVTLGFILGLQLCYSGIT